MKFFCFISIWLHNFCLTCNYLSKLTLSACLATKCILMAIFPMSRYLIPILRVIHAIQKFNSKNNKYFDWNVLHYILQNTNQNLAKNVVMNFIRHFFIQKWQKSRLILFRRFYVKIYCIKQRVTEREMESINWVSSKLNKMNLICFI